jgi:hypothetical protein
MTQFASADLCCSKDATAVFAITNFWLHIVSHGNVGAGEKETPEILNIAKAASQIPTLEHFILHSLPSAAKVAGPGYYVPHTDSKDRAVDLIQQTMPKLATKSTFLFVGSFTQNMWTRPFLKPFELPSHRGQYLWLLPISDTTKVAFAGSAYHNVGIFVRAILAHPEACLPAKYVMVATDELTMPEALKMWSQVTGKPAQFATISLDGFTELNGVFGEEVGLQYRMHEVQPDMAKPYRTHLVTMEDLGIDKVDLIDHKRALELNKEILLQ